FTPQELAEISGEFTPSEFVRGVTGVDNVCERAAVRAGGELIVRKQAGGGVTVAVSREPLVISLEGESA
ncbi:cobalamin biosynthesis protein, partial [Intestinimonas butyriciproducens]